MREILLQNKRLRSLDLHKLKLSSALRPALILFGELYGIPMNEQMDFIISTFNNSVF